MAGLLALASLLCAALSVLSLLAWLDAGAVLAWCLVGAGVTLVSMWQSRMMVLRVTLDPRFTLPGVALRHLLAFTLAMVLWPVIVPGLVRGRREEPHER